MEINGWTAPGEKERVTGVRGTAADATALRAAIRTARDEQRTDAEVLWRQARLNAGIRAAARIVVGFGSTVVVGLLLALAVVGADARSGLLAVLIGILVAGGGFVAVVWHLDVGITVHADGRLRRAGWNGVSEVDLRRYRRVTVKETARRDAMDAGFDGGSE